MSKSIPIESKTVFAPRGTATYTPKWSIVVLAVACLGVLKFNGPGAKTSTGREADARDTPVPENVAASLVPPVENKSQPIRPPPETSGTQANAPRLGTIDRGQDKDDDENE